MAPLPSVYTFALQSVNTVTGQTSYATLSFLAGWGLATISFLYPKRDPLKCCREWSAATTRLLYGRLDPLASG